MEIELEALRNLPHSGIETFEFDGVKHSTDEDAGRIFQQELKIVNDFVTHKRVYFTEPAYDNEALAVLMKGAEIFGRTSLEMVQNETRELLTYQLKYLNV